MKEYILNEENPTEESKVTISETVVKQRNVSVEELKEDYNQLMLEIDDYEKQIVKAKTKANEIVAEIEAINTNTTLKVNDIPQEII